MFRTSDVILIGVMVAAAGLTFKIKYDAELKYEEVRRLEAEIRTERDTIDVLEADLSVLTQPSRLQKLVDVYSEELQLRSVEPDQIGSVSTSPWRRHLGYRQAFACCIRSLTNLRGFANAR